MVARNTCLRLYSLRIVGLNVDCSKTEIGEIKWKYEIQWKFKKKES